MYFGSFAYSIYLFHSFGSAAGRILIKNIGVTNNYIIFFFSLSVGITAPIIVKKNTRSLGHHKDVISWSAIL
jgi:hypothetical protein